jgi:hypothetical protein
VASPRSEQFQFPHNFPGKTAVGTTTAEVWVVREVTLPKDSVQNMNGSGKDPNRCHSKKGIVQVMVMTTTVQ